MLYPEFQEFVINLNHVNDIMKGTHYYLLRIT